jgi:hypothetical protein
LDRRIARVIFSSPWIGSTTTINRVCPASNSCDDFEELGMTSKNSECNRSLTRKVLFYCLLTGQCVDYTYTYLELEMSRKGFRLVGGDCTVTEKSALPVVSLSRRGLWRPFPLRPVLKLLRLPPLFGSGVCAKVGVKGICLGVLFSGVFDGDKALLSGVLGRVGTEGVIAVALSPTHSRLTICASASVPLLSLQMESSC